VTNTYNSRPIQGNFVPRTLSLATSIPRPPSLCRGPLWFLHVKPCDPEMLLPWSKTRTCWTWRTAGALIAIEVQARVVLHVPPYSSNTPECHQWTPWQTGPTLHENRVHEVHEVCRRIHQPKWHDKIFIETISHCERHLGYIFSTNLDLVIAKVVINLRKHLGSS
jgi:hypothetical protein